MHAVSTWTLFPPFCSPLRPKPLDSEFQFDGKWCATKKICGPCLQSPGNLFPGNMPVSPSHPKLVRGVRIPKINVDFLYNMYFNIFWRPVRFSVQYIPDFQLDQFSTNVPESLSATLNQAGSNIRKRSDLPIGFWICFHSNHLFCPIPIWSSL